MQKKIESAYIYLDYRILLNEDFILRSDSNPSYSLRAYSRDLSLSPTFLSEVLRGKKDLSLQNCRVVFSKIGLLDKELDYVENLVTSKNSKSESARNFAIENIKNQYTGKEYIHKNSRDLLVKSLSHFVIFGLVRKIYSIQLLYHTAASIGIEQKMVDEVLDDYITGQYIKRENDEITVIDEEFTIKNHDKLVEISNQFNFLIHSQIQKENGIKVPDRVCHALIFGVSEHTYELICEAHKHFIKSVHRLSELDKSVERIVFISDAFYRMPQLPEIIKV